MCQAYREQYGLNAIYLLPVDVYGPGDNFDLQTSHVIPALIRKCLEAVESGADEIVAWGDGTPSREFLHVRDAAEGLLLAAERYDSSEPVNLGAGFEITVKELTQLLARLCGVKETIPRDTTRPNGHPRRKLTTDKAQRLCRFRAHLP